MRLSPAWLIWVKAGADAYVKYVLYLHDADRRGIYHPPQHITERFLSKIPYLCLFIHVINVANRHLKQPNLHLFSSTLKNLYSHQPTHIIKIQIWHGVKLYFPVVFVGTIFNTSENKLFSQFFLIKIYYVS